MSRACQSAFYYAARLVDGVVIIKAVGPVFAWA